MRQLPQVRDRGATFANKTDVPVVRYDAALFELCVNGVVVKRLDIRATAQIQILTAFEEEGWPCRIDDPLRPNGSESKARLRAIIHCLNGHQKPPRIHFFADGTGRGVRWELIENSG
jgi:hypothetical protein